MSKSYYECHITMIGDPAYIKPIVEHHKWKFSAIDGDPSLGDGIKCYATRHYNVKVRCADVVAEVKKTAAVLEQDGIKVVRRKVEAVLYDDRSITVKPEEM